MVAERDTERSLVEEFLREHPPDSEYWSSGQWFKDFKEGPVESDSREIEGAFARLLLHAAITASARGGAVNEKLVGEAIQSAADAGWA